MSKMVDARLHRKVCDLAEILTMEFERTKDKDRAIILAQSLLRVHQTRDTLALLLKGGNRGKKK